MQRSSTSWGSARGQEPDSHDPVASGTVQDVNAGESEEQRLPGLRNRFRCAFNAEKDTALCKAHLSVPVAQNAEVAYLHKPVGQYMEQESPDKLTGIKGHHFPAVPVGIVLPTKGYLPSIYADEAMIGESDPVSIPTQILDHGCGAMEGRLAVHHPFPCGEPREEPREGFLEESHRSGEVKLRFLQERENLPPEESGHHLDGEKKSPL